MRRVCCIKAVIGVAYQIQFLRLYACQFLSDLRVDEEEVGVRVDDWSAMVNRVNVAHSRSGVALLEIKDPLDPITCAELDGAGCCCELWDHESDFEW